MTNDDESRAFAARVGELEDQLKERNRRINEMKQEQDADRALISEMREHVEDANALIHRWIEAFGMVLGDAGDWQLDEWLATHDAYRTKYLDLARLWNRLVPAYNATVRKNAVGRPLEASDSQCAAILKAHKRGRSLRGIAEDLTLSFRTVRTVVERGEGRTRSHLKHMERIRLDRAAIASEAAQKRTRDALPRQINETLFLVGEAKRQPWGFYGAGRAYPGKGAAQRCRRQALIQQPSASTPQLGLATGSQLPLSLCGASP